MTQEALKLSQEALAGLKDVEKQVRELVAENRALKEALAKEKALQALHDENERLGLYKDAYAEPVKWSDYEPDGMHHNKPQKRPQNCGTGYCSCIECVMEPAQEPAPLRDAIVVNLVREGINKHKARELADHFIGLATAPAWVSLTDEEIDDIYQGVGKNDLMLVREVEAKLKEKNT